MKRDQILKVRRRVKDLNDVDLHCRKDYLYVSREVLVDFVQFLINKLEINGLE